MVPTERIIEWPSTLGTGDIRKLDGVFWHSVNELSAVGVRGTVPGKATAPAITPHVGSFNVTDPVYDMVTLRGAGYGGAQKRDAVLSSVFGGEELRISYVDQNDTEVVLELDHPGWRRASAMTTSNDLNGIDIVARSGNLKSVLRTRYDFQSGVFTQVPDVPVAETILDLCCVDFDADGQVDVAVLTGTKLSIYNTAGGLLEEHMLHHPGGAVEPAPQASMRGAIALLQRNDTDSGWELLHITDDAVESAVAVTINGADFSLLHMCSGDADGDLAYDLAIQAVGMTSILMRNDTSGNGHYSLGGATLIEAGDPSGTQGPGSMRDYDYDGNADLLVPILVNGTRSLVLRTGLASSLTANPWVFQDLFRISFFENERSEPAPPAPEVRLVLEIPDSLTAGSYDKVTATFYTASESGVSAGSEWAQEVPGSQVAYDVPAVAGPLVLVSPIPTAAIEHPALLFIKVQFTQIGNTRTKPTFLAGATINNDPPAMGDNPATSAYLTLNLLPMATPFPMRRSLASGRQQIGVIGAQKSLPYF